MIKKIVVLFLFTLPFFAMSQVTSIPQFPTPNTSAKLTFNGTEGNAGLAGYTGDVYIHTGVITNLSANDKDWKYVKAVWTTNLPECLMTRVSPNIYEITLGPSLRAYYGVPDNEQILKIACVFRSGDRTKEGKGTGNNDIFINVLSGAFGIALTAPTEQSLFVDQNYVIPISASASSSANFTLTVDGQAIPAANQNNTASFAYNLSVTQSTGSHEVVLSASDNASNSDEASFVYTLRSETIEESRPEWIIKGINYHETDNTKVTLCLLSPGKSSVYVVGDFNEWQVLDDYKMKKDGEFFWLEIDGLVSGEEYAFQYLIDEAIYVADPYAEKILESGDSYIPSGIYPNLKAFPSEVNRSIPFYNTVSVLQTNQTPFNWVNTAFEKPDKESLVIYEVLIRDFFDNGDESYANLLDTLSYLKSLGINAIELLPITEFAGNNSWGYNPNFMFAPDKAYGPKNQLKAFIDAAHGLGIAVILDMVLNQQDFPAPYVLSHMEMINDISSGGAGWYASKPAANNPWFNVTAPHLYSVFFDLNHESLYTQDFVDSVNYHWIHEYKFDGYRFDLTKGFMQTGSTDGFNQSRINILVRMANAIWDHTPDAYVIFEHLGVNDEEKILANNGIMLWGKMHENYKEVILGYENSKSNINWISHKSRGWNEANVVGYMESHDEERQLYEASQYANQGGYNARTHALDRMAAASAFFLPIPGPKMIWQFAELGFDLSIFRCEDGTLNTNNDSKNGDCRVSPKPAVWDNSETYNYYGNAYRDRLRQQMSALINLKTTYSVFSSGDASILGGNSLLKQITILNEANTTAPQNEDEMNVVVVGNFNVTASDYTATFPHLGTWYDYFTGESLSVSNTSTNINLPPGSFFLYTDYELETPTIILSADQQLKSQLSIFPNPTSTNISIELVGKELLYYFLYDINGRQVSRGKFQDPTNTIELSEKTNGLYFIEVITRSGEKHFAKVLKK